MQKPQKDAYHPALSPSCSSGELWMYQPRMTGWMKHSLEQSFAMGARKLGCGNGNEAAILNGLQGSQRISQFVERPGHDAVQVTEGSKPGFMGMLFLGFSVKSFLG